VPQCIPIMGIFGTFGDTLFKTVVDCWDTGDEEVGDDGASSLGCSDTRSEESGLIVIVQKVGNHRGVL